MKKLPLLVIGAVLALTLANILAGFRFYIGPVAITWGVLLIPILMLLGDTVHEVWGFGWSQRITWLAITLTIGVYAILHLTGIMPTGLFVAVRIIAGSMIATATADLVNDLVFQLIKKRSDNMSLRHIGSSAPALLVDAVVFQVLRNAPLPIVPVEFNAQAFPWFNIATTTIAVVILRVLCEILLWPITRRIIGWCKN